ncbi:MAG: glycosyl hydrolase family 28 protein, partial [Candidatus Ornithomonoglobus sp.]
MERKRTQKLLAALTAAAMAAAAFPAGVPWVYAAEGAVHDYGKPGDDPATEADESAAVYNSDVLKSASYAESTKYGVTANGTAVTAYKYQHSTTEGNKYYKMDVVRFSSDDAQPEMAVTLKNGSTIENVTVYPQRYYPQEALTISADKKTVSFKMSSALRYCIVYINGSAVEQSGHPALTIINDPTETNKPDIDAANVLNFGTFSKQYLADNPINDTVGEVCTVAGTVTSTSETVLKGHSYSYDTGYYVDYDTSSVTFPNKRVRLSNDVTDAFQAALAKVAADASLDTIYIPAGSYVWSGLSIKDWDGEKNGALNIYLDEDALMVNRLQECQEAMEPAIGIWNSSKITISGRGIIDGQGTYNYERDSQGAGISCHQGGCMVVQSSDITFNDTYMRDAKQWNWECHTGKNVTYNNIKGLSPYEHSWVDGLDITSGQDITINGALTLGYDDTFATGHYNPNNYFAPQGTDSNFDAATIIYNDNYDKWDTEDTLNYSINNTLGWTTKANGAQFGFALNWKDYNAETGKFDASYQQKNYEFNNLNSVLEYTGNAIRIMNGQAGGYPRYETIVFKDCSFDGSNGANAQFPNTTNLTDFNPNITMENCWFNDSSQEFYANSVNNFTIKDLYVDNKLVKYTSQINYSFENIGSLTFLANGENVTENTLPEITYPADGAAFESYAKQPVAFTVKAADADGDKVS